MNIFQASLVTRSLCLFQSLVPITMTRMRKSTKAIRQFDRSLLLPTAGPHLSGDYLTK